MMACWMRIGSIEANDDLVGKCWDLSDAYKQVPLSDEAFDLDSYLAVYDPSTGSAKIFKQSILPFGSIASVTAFLRVALATWKVGASLPKLMWSACFDDFLDAIFSLLGWRIAKHRLIAFDFLWKVLGVQLDLTQSGDQLCFVSNTEDRVEELVKDIGDILTSKLLTRAEGEKLRGRLQFASSQVFGRKFRRPLKTLSNHVTQGRKSVSDQTMKCLADISQLLQENTPWRISASHFEVLHIYVDASFDVSSYSGLGGVVINMLGEQLSFFSTKVEEMAIEAMRSKGQRTIIQELEMMAVLGALRSWEDDLSRHRVVLFTDSEAVRGSFLRSWSANEDSDCLMDVIFDIEARFEIPVWIKRVPSQSSPCDILSRVVVTVLGDAKQVEVDPWEMWSLVASQPKA